MSTALQLTNTDQQLIQLDIIASGVVSDKSVNILSTIGKKVGIIINTARGDIYNYNCILDYSTRYVDSHCNRSLIGRYFTHRIKNLSRGLNITISTDIVIKDGMKKIADILKPILYILQGRSVETKSLDTFKNIIGAISGVLNIIKTGFIVIYPESLPNSLYWKALMLISPPFTGLFMLISAGVLSGLSNPQSYVLFVLFAIMAIIELIGEYHGIRYILDSFNENDISTGKSTKYIEIDIQQRDIKLTTLINYLKQYIQLMPSNRPVIETLSPDQQIILDFAYEVGMKFKNIPS